MQALGSTLYLLIRAGKNLEVEEFLRDNENALLVKCSFIDILERKVDGKGKNTVESFVCNDSNSDFSGCSLSPLFPAILRVFRNQDSAAASVNSLNVLSSLLRHGFSPTAVESSVRACNIGHWNQIGRQNETPSSFAMWLNFEMNSAPTPAMTSTMQQLKDASQRGITRPMAQVPSATKAFWRSLLFSEIASDVRFRCITADGLPQMVPAIKGVLIAASDYFRAQLSGAWQDSHADGVIETTLSAVIVKAIMVFIYCGEVDSTLLEGQTAALLRASCEFMLVDLKHICEGQLARTLTKELIAEALVTAHLHDCELLQKACHSFLKANPSVLTKSSFFALSNTFPELWKNLTIALGGDIEDDEEEKDGELGGVGDKRKR